MIWIDRIVRGIATAQGDNTSLGISAGDVLFSINQITNPSLSCSSESADAVDALNVPIATFYRAKNCEFSAENALFDMSLMATQSGAKKKVAGVASATIECPCFETQDIASGTGTTLTLKHTPKTGTTPKVYVLKGDGTLESKIAVDTSASGRTAVAISGTTVTFVRKSDSAAGFEAGEQLFFMYDYIADGTEGNGAVEVVNSATQFPVGCKFIMEILGADVCDQTNKLVA